MCQIKKIRKLLTLLNRISKESLAPILHHSLVGNNITNTV